MTVRERLLAIGLMEKEARDPRYAAKLGVHVYWKSGPAPADDEKKEKKERCLKF